VLFIVKVTVQVLVTVVRIDVVVVEVVEVVDVVDVVDVDEIDVVDVVEDELAWIASTNQIADSPGLSVQLPDETWF
jgi:septum formation inhibitor-activating ATPase MinD